MIRIVIIEIPIRHSAGLRNTQPRYEAPGGLWVKIVQMQWLTSGWWGCPLENHLQSWPWGSQITVKKKYNSRPSKWKLFMFWPEDFSHNLHLTCLAGFWRVTSNKSNLYDSIFLQHLEAFLEECSNAFPETMLETLPKIFLRSFLEKIINILSICRGITKGFHQGIL